MQRIGVFVCHCGSNIAATVDVEAVAAAAKKVPGVVFSADYMYMCSEAGQALVKDTIKNEKLTGALRGTAYHRIFELYDFDMECNEENVRNFMKRLLDDGKIDDGMYNTVKIQDIITFANSSMTKCTCTGSLPPCTISAW